MQRVIYFLVLAVLLLGYYELLGPGPGPSDLPEDLEWWRPFGWAHSWTAFAGLERMAEEGGAGALVPLGIFWLPVVAMLVWGFKLFRSTILRALVAAGSILLAVFAYYGWLANKVWRFFELSSVEVMATFAVLMAATLLAPSLLRAALDRSRVLAAIALAAAFAGVFVLTTEITGTDSDMRLNLSPWPVVTLFGLLLIGSTIATLHIAAGLGSWVAARLGSMRGLAAGALAAAVVALALTALSAPGAGALVTMAVLGIGYALARAWLGPESRDEAARAGLVTLAAGLFILFSIHASNRAAIAFQKTARNETSMEVLVALESYREANGKYPRRLPELVPDFLPEVPYPRIGLIADEQDEFMFRNLGDSYVLEFASVQWVQCGYSPPFNVAKYSEEDYEDEEEEDEDEFAEPLPDPELEALLADHGLDGAWNCEDAPPKMW